MDKVKLRPGMVVYLNDRPARLVEILDGRPNEVDAAVIRYWNEKEARVVLLKKLVPGDEPGEEESDAKHS